MADEYDEMLDAAIGKIDFQDAPDLIITTTDPEYWQDVAAFACRNNKVEPDLYVADITDWLDSPELGPQLGGECIVYSDLAEWDIREWRVRCELVRAFKTEAGRWLAVYEVEAA